MLVQQEKVSGSFKVFFSMIKGPVQKSQLHVCFLFPELLMITVCSIEKEENTVFVMSSFSHPKCLH